MPYQQPQELILMTQIQHMLYLYQMVTQHSEIQKEHIQIIIMITIETITTHIVFGDLETKMTQQYQDVMSMQKMMLKQL